jgi:hypothetical protein
MSASGGRFQVETFSSSRSACHGGRRSSGKRLASAAAVKASAASSAEAVWWPWLGPSVEKRVMMMSGRTVRMARTTSASTRSWPQSRKDSSGFLLYPKSRACG